MDGQPTAEMVEQVSQIPIYRDSVRRGHFPVLEKTEIARGFPDNWMTPQLAEALRTGQAEFVLSTGTNHARMQIIRPPYFLLKSYYRLWSEHPELSRTWAADCQRVSITTVLATEHVARVNAAKHGGQPQPVPSLADRRLDERTTYLNLHLDPQLWQRADVERMLSEISLVQQAHPQGWYHLDCSSYHLAHLARKVTEWDLWDRFPKPASIVHAYEYTPVNVRRYLELVFDCPIVDLFGSTELGYMYYSDQDGTYRPYLDKMSVELLPVAPGSTIYSLIVSSVRNPYMPLIRYRSGDCARTADGTPDPTKITRFCGREKELLRLDRALVSQDDLDSWISGTTPEVFVYQLHVTETARLSYTTFDNHSLSPEDESRLARTVFEATGLRCEVLHSTHIPIGKSGKYAWLVNELGSGQE
ncbi:hypothetical protein [Kutzneria albida]|uniref:Phenylacetate-CoA ligase n=1 Tax=Kutzneria albida DSM 43870 TaxID=1449976 RepID=W5WEY8_9PSEU|nr:hypothetical protein [Kutzneria albida]AHH99330.1 hypothetical protein KALB_5970 [Kutzneria albida DSM 43870]